MNKRILSLLAALLLLNAASAMAASYQTLEYGDKGSDVQQMQEALRALGYLDDKADGKFGKNTKAAVIAFQQKNGLVVDGKAGSKTLTLLYSLYGGASAPPEVETDLDSGSIFTVYDPATSLSWKMKLYSPGNHADSEPLTAADAAIMYKAYGDKWTWSQRAVYVQLANGTWCIAAMPNMPHLSGSISDNDFEGHTCVHFSRTMTECAQNDPDYGVSVQETIRVHWKKITGEEIPW